jgi:hypothetical protein
LRRLGQQCGAAALALDAAIFGGLVPAAVVAAPSLFPRIEAEE